MSFKPLITSEPRIGKFRNWAEMKVNYSTDNKNTQMDFSDNFHDIKNFVQVDPHRKNYEKSPHFFFLPLSKKNDGDRQDFLIIKNECL
jgi:hypothetical protein